MLFCYFLFILHLLCILSNGFLGEKKDIEEMSFVKKINKIMGILYLTVIYDLECLCLIRLGGPAHQAGLQQLDTVLQLNGQPVEHWKCVDLAHAIRCVGMFLGIIL